MTTSISLAATRGNDATEDWSLEGFRGRARKGARSNIVVGAIIVLLHLLGLWFGLIKFSHLFRSYFFAIGVVGLVLGVWRARRVRLLTEADVEEARESRAFAETIGRTELTYTYGILACLITVAVVELLSGDAKSIQAAGLVKSAVRQGEVWRLLTSATIHANFFHIWMNSQALLGFGRLIEGVANRAYLSIVFLISALGGSVFSLVLMPNTTSVGASGGLMGLVGFLAVYGYRRKSQLPSGFLGSILFNIGLVGAIGLIGFGFIDNAAHFGGTVAGAGCGALLVDDVEAEPAPPGSKVGAAGAVCLILIVLTSLLSIVLIRS